VSKQSGKTVCAVCVGVADKFPRFRLVNFFALPFDFRKPHIPHTEPRKLFALKGLVNHRFLQFSPAVLDCNPAVSVFSPAVLVFSPAVLVFNPAVLVFNPPVLVFSPPVLVCSPPVLVFNPKLPDFSPPVLDFSPKLPDCSPPVLDFNPKLPDCNPAVSVFNPKLPILLYYFLTGVLSLHNPINLLPNAIVWFDKARRMG
jgi:hypothetical protein